VRWPLVTLARVRYRVLGPLQIEDGHRGSLGGWKEQAVLAQLLANANSAMRAGQLAFGPWGEAQPATAGRTLQAYVARLRRALAPAPDGRSTVLVTVADGWMLRVDPDDIDAWAFEALLREARVALADGHAAQAGHQLKRALGLWRGDAYAGFDDLPACRAEAVRLTELRKLAEDEWLAARLGAGETEEVITEAEGLLLAEPLRETRWALLIRAQCLAGRPADALDTYARARAVLRDELGVDPGPELQRLQRAILSGDPELSAAASGREEVPGALARAGPPLVGRDAELDRLGTRWSAACRGAGGVLVMAGVSGVGKSRLAAEVVRRVSGQGAVVRHASAGTGTNPETLLTGLLSGTDRGSSLMTGAAGTPALLVLDDVRRVDGSLLAALPRLAKELVDRPVLVLVLAGEEPGSITAPVELPVLRLGPLPDENIAEIAAGYQAGGIRIDVAHVVAAARGLPLRAHALAAAAASRAAARRIRVAAHRAERSRRGLAAVHGELTEGVLAAEEIRRRAIASLPADAPAHPVRVPYQGLAAFEAEDAEVFFGRERAVADLVARLAAGRFLAVVGPSGCGKSSLVRAGLLPALRAGALPGSADWPVQLLTPAEGGPPAIAPDGLLVVDQLEELFTAGPASEVDRHLAALSTAARAGRVLVTLRSDFYPEAAAHPVLGPLLEAGTAVLGPMRLEELRRAVAEPALAVGLDITDDLVDIVLQDLAGQPGALPLLSVALLETYRRRSGPILRPDAYRAAGGVDGALALLAERAYAGLRPRQREAARRVLVRLAEEDRGRLVRRRAPLAEVVPTGEEAAAAAVEALAQQRLLVVAEGTVEVAHEALLAAWPRCRDWLAADAAGRQIRGRLSAAAATWQSAGRQESDLYRGMRLAEAADWAAGHDDELTPLERDFLDQSRAAAQRQRLAAEARAVHQARQARRLRYALAGVATFLAASLVAGLLAVRAARASRAEADAEAAARLGALALTEQQVDTAALLAAQAVALHDSPETRADLLSTLLRWPQVRRVTVPTGGRLLGMGLSADGRQIAVTDNHGMVAQVDTATWRRRGPLLDIRGWRAFDAAYSADGRLLVATAQTSASDEVISVRDAVTGAELQRSTSPSAVVFAWAPPGSPVVGVSGSTDAMASWTGPTGHWTQHLLPAASWPVPVAFDPDGRRLLVAEQTGWATWYDPLTWRPAGSRVPISRHETWAALDPGRRVLAVGDDDGTIRLLDAHTGQVRLTLGGHRGVIQDLGFDSTGQRLVSTADDGTAVVWNLATGDRIWSFSGLGGLVAVSATFAASGSRPGDRLYLASHDRTLLEVNLTGALLGQPASAAPAEDDAAWPAGHAPVSIGISGVLHPVHLGAQQPPGPPPANLGTNAYMVAVPGADEVLLGDAGNVPGRVALVDLSGHVIREFRAGSPRPEGDVSQVAAAPAARLVFAATGERQVLAYDGATGTLLWSRRFGTYDDPFLRGARLAYDARRNALAVSLGDHRVVIVEAATGRTRRVLRVTDEVIPSTVAFDPHTGTLLTGNNDGTLGFWDPDTGRRLVPPVPGPPAYPRILQVSDVGGRAATIGHDGSVAVWDTAARRMLARLPTHGATASAIALAPDGRRLLVIEPDGTATVWDLDENAWLQAACALAGRVLTRDEWQRFLPGRPYLPACQGG
jgi:WD40 repeat protein/DNA-binding SARP family transcriptional activator